MTRNISQSSIYFPQSLARNVIYFSKTFKENGTVKKL